jgi:Tfp pilus assembly PilM family ATPase/Tfp pilus assembly protein PilN
MPKRCIGIDIGRSHVHAVQMARTPEGFCLERAFGVQTRRSTDSLPDILQSLTRHYGFDRRAEVAVSLPHHIFFFADIEIDEAGLQRLRAADVTALRNHFPIPAEDIVAQVCSVLRFAGSKDSALIAATSTETLREQLQPLKEAGIRPVRVDTPITAAHAAVMMNHPESARGIALILYANESTLSLAVTHDGKLLLVRNIPVVSTPDASAASLARELAEVVGQEVEITWKRLFDTAPDASLRIFLVAAPTRVEMLMLSLQNKIDGQITLVNPYAHVARTAGVEADFPLCIAEGLALRTLQPETAGGIDFLAPYYAQTRPHREARRELRVCAGLAAGIAAVWVIGLFLQLSSLESDYARLKRQAVELFRQTVPEEQNIIDPAAQLQQKLDTLRKDAELFTCFNPGPLAPLEILQALSERTPAQGEPRLDDVLIAGGSVRVTGSCDSFATLSEWQRLLETIPGLQVVDVPSPKKDGSGKVQFTISLSSIKGKA